MTKPRSNSRRFVSAAWALLTFQLIASAGAVGVTGYAAFYVSDLIGKAPQADAAVEEATATQDEPAPTAEPAPIDAQAPQGVPVYPGQTTPTPAPAETQAAPQAYAAPAEAAPAGPVNDGPGRLSLAPDERGNINASLSDPDGVATTPRIQWFRNGGFVSYASGPTYSLRYDDSQAAITARAEYVDGDGFRETVTSAPFQVGVIIP